MAIHPLVAETFHSKPEPKPAGGKARQSPKSLGFILWVPWIFVSNSRSVIFISNSIHCLSDLWMYKENQIKHRRRGADLQTLLSQCKSMGKSIFGSNSIMLNWFQSSVLFLYPVLLFIHPWSGPWHTLFPYLCPLYEYEMMEISDTTPSHYTCLLKWEPLMDKS